jgi:hypothetical protein
MPIVGDAKKVLNDPQITELDAAYLAGFVDGEGCISVATRLGKYLTPTVQVSNTNQAILEYFLSKFGGTIDVRRDTRPTRKQCNTWRVAGNEARIILRKLLPYLRVKAPQALLALEYVPKGSGYRLTQDDQMRIPIIISQMRKLNQRGVPCQS